MKPFTKKILSFALALTLGLPGSLFAVQAEETKKGEEVTKQIQILQTSDIHGKFMPFKYATYSEDYSGSLAQIATVIKEKRNENTILMDVGDTIQDNSAEIFMDEEIHPMMLAFNLLNYDYWCVGNHEFDYEIPTLKRVMNQFKGTTFCGNVYDKDGETKLGETYKIQEIDGVRIAVIGMVTPNIVHWDETNLEGYKVTNPIDEVKAAIAEVKNQVDVIVVACHMDTTNQFDLVGSGAYDLAEACPEIDVICAAHGHQNVVEYVNNGKTLIAENLNAGQTINDIDITVQSDGQGGYEVVGLTCETTRISEDIPVDEEIGEALEPYNEKAKQDALSPIGTLEGGDLVNPTEIQGIPQALIEESAMVNLINDVQMYYSGADVSAASVVGPEANIKEGEIRKCDTSSIYQYDNTLYKIQMTGAQLKQYMEWSVNFYNTFKEGDLTISFSSEMASYLFDIFGGVRYDVNISKKSGSRIENLTRMDGTPIEEDDTIVLAVNNFRANSQLLNDGAVFSTAKGDTLPVLLEKDCQGSTAIRDLITKYIQEVKGGTISPVYYNSWKLTGYSWDAEKHEKAAELINAGKIQLSASENGKCTNIKSITEADLEAFEKQE